MQIMWSGDLLWQRVRVEYNNAGGKQFFFVVDCWLYPTSSIFCSLLGETLTLHFAKAKSITLRQAGGTRLFITIKSLVFSHIVAGYEMISFHHSLLLLFLIGEIASQARLFR